MAITARHSRQNNMAIWGGIAAATFVVLVALGYWMDWFATGETEIVAPAVEQSAPANE